MSPVIAARAKSSSIATASSARRPAVPEIPPLQVAAGVLLDESGRALISQRPPGKSWAGAWEFPGGKILPHEVPLQGLLRELREELGIGVAVARHLARYTHDYPGQPVELHVWRVLAWEGEPNSCEGQPLQWLPLEQLLPAGLLPADEPLVHLLMAATPVTTLSWEAALAGGAANRSD